MQTTMTRRTFTKVAAASAVAAALGPIGSSNLEHAGQAWASSSDEYEVINTVCGGCITNCPVKAYMKNGRLVKILGNPSGPLNRGAVCLKGMSQVQALYHPNRNKYPMRRVGERGENKWERMSWDDAIAYAAENIYDAYVKYGPEVIFGSAGGGGSPALETMGMFVAAIGASNAFEPGGAQCFLPRRTINEQGLNCGFNSYADGGGTEVFNPNSGQTTMVWWGTCPAYNQTAMGNLGAVDLRQRGVKTVVVDPRLTPDAARADVWLPLRAGTDPALMLCFIKYIIEDELYDEEFCKYWSNLPFLIDPTTKLPIEAEAVFAEFSNPFGEPAFVCYDELTGTIQPLVYCDPDDLTVDPALFKRDLEVSLLDGTVLTGVQTAFEHFRDAAEDYDYDTTAEITWCDADKIKTALRYYAEPAASMAIGVATDQNPNSGGSSIGAQAMEIMLGHVGGPGHVFASGKPRSTARPSRTLSDKNDKYMINPPEQIANRLYGGHYGLLAWSHCHITTLLHAIESGEPYQPRVWFDFSGNKLAMLANPAAWVKARENLDFIIGEYMYCTSFHIEMCDIVFPNTEWGETLGNHTKTMRSNLNASFMRRPLTHLYEDVDHLIITGKIVEKLIELGHEGLRKSFDQGAWVTSFEQQKEEAVAQFKADSWEDLLEHQAEREDMSEEDLQKLYDKTWVYYGYKGTCDDGAPFGFGTYTRKAECYADYMIKMGRTGAPFTNKYPGVLPDSATIRDDGDFAAVPYYVEPVESPNDPEIANDYPLVMSNGRTPIYHHGTLRNVPFLREIMPTATVCINTDTAHDLGINHYDWVKVSSQRGSIVARAYLTQGINPREVYMERFWNPEMFDESNSEYSGGWAEMNVNNLSRNEAPFGREFGSYTLRGYQVAIEPVDGPPAGIWYKPEDFKPWLPVLSEETEAVF